MGHNTRMKPTCQTCGDHYSPKRKAAGYKVCLWCGEEQAMQERKSWCIGQAYSKGGYQLITNPTDLKVNNPKRNDIDMTDYARSMAELGDALL